MSQKPNFESRIRPRDGRLMYYKNIRTGIKIQHMPSRVFDILIKLNEGEAHKKFVCESIWGKDDYFVRRCLDVYVRQIRIMLVGSDYRLITRTNFVKLIKIEN